MDRRQTTQQTITIHRGQESGGKKKIKHLGNCRSFLTGRWTRNLVRYYHFGVFRTNQEDAHIFLTSGAKFPLSLYFGESTTGNSINFSSYV